MAQSRRLPDLPAVGSRAPAFLLLALVASCGGDVDAGDARGSTVSAETFAEVLGELAAARVRSLPDTAEYRRRRAEILREAGVDPEELRRFARIRGGDADLMAAIYGRAELRIDSAAVRQARTGAAAGGEAAIAGDTTAASGAGRVAPDEAP